MLHTLSGLSRYWGQWDSQSYGGTDRLIQGLLQCIQNSSSANNGETSVLHWDVCEFVCGENFSVDEKWTKNGTRNGRCGVEDCVFMQECVGNEGIVDAKGRGNEEVQKQPGRIGVALELVEIWAIENKLWQWQKVENVDWRSSGNSSVEMESNMRHLNVAWYGQYSV